MPDFDTLHLLASNLAALTAAPEQHPGLATWNLMVGEIWKDIVAMWYPDAELRHHILDIVLADYLRHSKPVTNSSRASIYDPIEALIIWSHNRAKGEPTSNAR